MTILMILTVTQRFAVLRENKKKIFCGKSQSSQTALTVCHLPAGKEKYLPRPFKRENPIEISQLQKKTDTHKNLFEMLKFTRLFQVLRSHQPTHRRTLLYTEIAIPWPGLLRGGPRFFLPLLL